MNMPKKSLLAHSNFQEKRKTNLYISILHLPSHWKRAQTGKAYAQKA
jgi:hypothetical protein